MKSMNQDVKIEFPGIIRVYKDGFVERLFPDINVPASAEDPETRVSSKDVKFFSLSARLYLPKITNPVSHKKLPVLVYYHGGAFCLRSPESMVYHRYLNILASMARVLIISVKYRLAPEHPLPAAYEDSWAALKLVGSNPGFDPWLAHHGDLDSLFIGGDNAGGNIVHNLAIRAGSEPLNSLNRVKIRGAFLSHPYILDERSAKLEVAHKMWEFIYPNAPGGSNCPMINPMSPGAPSLSRLGCSRFLVLVAGKDEMRESEIRYYNAIKASGYNGKLELYVQEDENHVYHIVDPDAQNSKLLFQRLADFLNE
ncbi:2-hydroxyisoflavanone dehydratase-like [Silene latifolia]|uniref:2-hydroxyisoflavanone dehydratase-like n=1 Tax=Silene latifolia TaxID=37657 RepID=UPI003D7846CE